MKLRIRAGSLRLRLTQGEVQEPAEHGTVERIQFGGGVALTYRLTPG